MAITTLPVPPHGSHCKDSRTWIPQVASFLSLIVLPLQVLILIELVVKFLGRYGSNFVYNSMTFGVLPPSENCRKYSSDIRESKCVVVSSVLHSSVTE